jgi:hypothetical protein
LSKIWPASLRADAVGLRRAFDELAALLGHFLRVLLAHRAAQQVGAAERVAGQQLGGVLDLFLIDHHAVGVAADLLEQRMLVHRLLAALLHLDHLVDELHRARAVEREQVDDVVDLLDLVFAAGFDHAAGFQLEHAHRLAAVEDFEGRLVVERHLSISKSGLCLRMCSTASWMTVRFFRPRKSILSRPTSVMAPMSYWVTTSPSLPRVSGTCSSSGRSPMTTPAAWMPTLRLMPSSLSA